MLRKLIESITFFGAMFFFSGIESSIWCGVLGLVLLMLFCLEVYLLDFYSHAFSGERPKQLRCDYITSGEDIQI